MRKALPCSDLWAPSPGPVSGSLTRRQPGRKGAGEAVQGPSPDHPAPRVRSAASRQEARAPSRTLGRTLDLGAVWGGEGCGPEARRLSKDTRRWQLGRWGNEQGPADQGGREGPAPGVSESGAGQLLQKSTTGAPKGLKKGPGISFFGQGVQRKEPLFLL